MGEASAWRLAADQRSAAWRAIRAGLPLLHPEALKAVEQCNDRFWPTVEERIIKKKLVSTLLCSTWMVYGSIFYRLWDFLFVCFTVKPDVFRFSGGFLDVERDWTAVPELSIQRQYLQLRTTQAHPSGWPEAQPRVLTGGQVLGI